MNSSPCEISQSPGEAWKVTCGGSMASESVIQPTSHFDYKALHPLLAPSDFTVCRSPLLTLPTYYAEQGLCNGWVSVRPSRLSTAAAAAALRAEGIDR